MASLIYVRTTATFQTMCINANKSPLTSLELNHSSGSGLVNHSVTTLLTSDGVTLSQGERGTALGTVVLDAQRLAGNVTVGSVGDGCWCTETFSLRRRHDGRRDEDEFFRTTYVGCGGVQDAILDSTPPFTGATQESSRRPFPLCSTSSRTSAPTIRSGRLP